MMSNSGMIGRALHTEVVMWTEQAAKEAEERKRSMPNAYGYIMSQISGGGAY